PAADACISVRQSLARRARTKYARRTRPIDAGTANPSLQRACAGCPSAQMRFACVLQLSIFCAACATTPASLPPPPVSTVPQQSIDYLKTLGGGWRIRLTDDHRAVTACQYGLTVGPARPFNKTLYLRAEFENPLDPSSPLITDTKIEPWMREL